MLDTTPITIGDSANAPWEAIDFKEMYRKEREAALPKKKEKSDKNISIVELSQKYFRKALSCKTQGNELFLIGHYNKAIEKYMNAIQMINNAKKTEAVAAIPRTLEVDLVNNVAACYLKTEEWNKAVKVLSPIIDQCKIYKDISIKAKTKSLYRRALSWSHLNMHENSVEDLSELLQIEPNNKKALKLQRKLKIILRDKRTKEKQKLSQNLAAGLSRDTKNFNIDGENSMKVNSTNENVLHLSSEERNYLKLKFPNYRKLPFDEIREIVSNMSQNTGSIGRSETQIQLSQNKTSYKNKRQKDEQIVLHEVDSELTAAWNKMSERKEAGDKNIHQMSVAYSMTRKYHE